MLHARENAEGKIKEISQKYKLSDFVALKTLKEYKKVRLKLFLEENSGNF